MAGSSGKIWRYGSKTVSLSSTFVSSRVSPNCDESGIEVENILPKTKTTKQLVKLLYELMEHPKRGISPDRSNQTPASLFEKNIRKRASGLRYVRGENSCVGLPVERYYTFFDRNN